MTTPTSADLAALGLSGRWALCSLNRPALTERRGAAAALADFFDGFHPEATLATFRSGVQLLGPGGDLPDDLGPPLHLEGARGEETRVLRHLHGAGWRVSRLIEGEGDDLLGETVDWLGTGATGEGAVDALTYRRYWRVGEDGALIPVAARLVGVAVGRRAGP